MSRDFLELENGISMDGSVLNFRLMYNNQPLTPTCYRLGYMRGVLIATQCDKVIIYKPEIKIVDNVPALVKIAEFSAYETGAYLKVAIGEKSYIIDSNVQITSCTCKKLH